MRILDPRELALSGPETLDDLLVAREMIVAAGDNEIRGAAAAVLLFADYAVIEEGAVIVLDAPETWAGVVWRIGRRALPISLGTGRVGSRDAVATGLCDAVYEGPFEDWLASWMKGRSPAALESAAMLIRQRGGDRLEAAEFARLFATGEPREGLTAFLDRRRG